MLGCFSLRYCQILLGSVEIIAKSAYSAKWVGYFFTGWIHQLYYQPNIMFINEKIRIRKSSIQAKSQLFNIEDMVQQKDYRIIVVPSKEESKIQSIMGQRIKTIHELQHQKNKNLLFNKDSFLKQDKIDRKNRRKSFNSYPSIPTHQISTLTKRKSMKLTVNQVHYDKINQRHKIQSPQLKHKQLNQVKYCIRLKKQLKKSNKINFILNSSRKNLQLQQQKIKPQDNM